MPTDEERQGDEQANPRDITLTGVIFEVSLAAIALVIGCVVGYSPIQSIELGWNAVPGHLVSLLHGLLATIPLLALPLVINRVPWRAFRELREDVNQIVVPMFRNEPIIGLALISLAAGIGEEILFRGLIQGGLYARSPTELGLWLAILTASMLFGLVHFLSAAYALVATLIGCYLGWLYWYTGELITPMVTHAVYDFLAMVYFVKLAPGRAPRD